MSITPTGRIGGSSKRPSGIWEGCLKAQGGFGSLEDKTGGPGVTRTPGGAVVPITP